MRLLLPALLLCSTTAWPQNAAVTIDVNTTTGRKPINPLIYGVNYGTATTLADLNAPLHRLGGNNTSRYNWRLNADNRAFDWYFESIAEADATPGGRGDAFYSLNKAAGAESMLTVPIIGWVAKLGSNRAKLASFSIQKYGSQTGNDWQWFPDAGNGVRTAGGYVTGNDPNDANILFTSADQREWVQQLVNKWGTASNGGIRYYVLDNEHSIWFATHRDVAPTGMRATEMRDRMLEYADAIKAADPSAQVVGPEEWGWSGFILSGYDQQWGAKYGWGNLPDRASIGNQDYVPYLLSQWKSLNRKPIDVFSLHYYPQSGEYSSDVSSSMQLMRNKSTRSLWDATYTDQSWIATQVQLIPRMKKWIADYYYPGTPTAITEYNWGAENHINGATTQADIYGIFGREGLDMATRWTTPDPSTPTYKAMKMYRNYDGAKNTFGDISVSTAVPNPDNLSAFSAERARDGALTVMVVSKVLSGSTPVTLKVAGFSGAATAQVYQLTAANAINRIADVAFSSGQLATSVPAQSVTLFVLPSSGGNRPPIAAISANVTSGFAPLAVNFSSAGSSDPDGSIASYEWTFGDGATATGASAAHTYQTPGTYTAILKVTDNSGAASTASTAITVKAVPTNACAIRYTVSNDWKTGFTGDIVISNTGTTAINGWTLVWNFPGNQKITSLWNGAYTQKGKTVTVKNVSWNAAIAAGATTQLGFNANYSGTNAKPAQELRTPKR